MPEREVSTQLRDMQAQVNDMREQLVEHRVRLSNGQKSFHDHDDRIHDLEKTTGPKPTQWTRIAGLALGVLFATVGAIWALQLAFQARPTTEQMREVMARHDDYGHPDIRNEVRDLRDSIIEQRSLTKRLEQLVDVLEKK
jgi:tetrahydromethanopterin S-methyltransferase subunit F